MIFDPEWANREPQNVELPEGVELPAEWFEPGLPEGFTACPWCPASGPPNFMNGHMKRHEDEGDRLNDRDLIADLVAAQVRFEGRALDSAILHEIADERIRQDDKWGEQNHPDGTGTTWIEDLMPFAWREDRAAHIALLAKAQCQREARTGRSTWRGIALEEIAEAFAETDPELLRAELVQAAAVLVNWIGAIDRRRTDEVHD